MLERAGPLGVDRVLRVDGHTELAREEAEAPGVVRPAHRAAVVEIEARCDARVGRGDEPVREGDRVSTVLREREVVVLEERERRRLVVELVDKQDVRPSALDDLCHGLGLRIARRGEVGEQLAGEVPLERRVEGREADCLDAAAVRRRRAPFPRATRPR
jgi:hypothetical protein